MNWTKLKAWIFFFSKTWRSPNSYRRLFRQISSCYLTPGTPGKARVAGVVTECVTNTAKMIMVIDGCRIFYIDREALTVQQGTSDDEFPLWDPRVRELKGVFDSMLRYGMPYKMSDTNVTYAGI
jgi:hypothetical protein